MSNRRDEQRKYEGDLQYEIWKRGGNPDNVHPDQISDYFWEGMSVESAASRELNKRRQPESEEETL